MNEIILFAKNHLNITQSEKFDSLKNCPEGRGLGFKVAPNIPKLKLNVDRKPQAPYGSRMR
jgi:hypothetical protein